MFSCCRANPKNSKKSKKQNEDTAKEQQQQQKISQQNDASTKSDNKKLIIPTITIENGKTTTDNVSNNEQQQQQTQQVGINTVIACLNNEIDKLSENENVTTAIATTEAIEKSLKETETVDAQTTTTATAIAVEEEAAVAVTTTTAETNVDSDHVSLPNDVEIICCKPFTYTNNCLQNNSEEVETITNDAVTPTHSSETHTNDENNTSQTNGRAESRSTTITTQSSISRCDANANTNTNINTANNGKPKSCLSRHNSTHTSIKKRVNISVHTEIIEPDPLLPILVPITSSIGDEEDDVFSDSVSPPKRESMCAPYLERDINNDDMVSETLAYAHGLPEWFNDERINDV